MKGETEMTDLECAESWLEYGDKRRGIMVCRDYRKAILGELARLRSEISALKGEAESTVYAVGTTADGAVACALAFRWWHLAEECHPVEGQDVYAVRVSARKVGT